MGGFLGIGNSSAKTDRNQTLAGYQDLNQLFGFAFPQGQKGIAQGGATTGQGLSGLTGAQSYFQKLASGNRPALLSAVAPEVNAANTQADASRRQQASTGTARGGGTAGVNQQADTAKQAEIDNMLFGAQGAGAQGEAATGSAISNVGLEQTSQGIQELSAADTAANQVTQASITSRPESFKENQAIQKQIMGMVVGAISGGLTGGLGAQSLGL